MEHNESEHEQFDDTDIDGDDTYMEETTEEGEVLTGQHKLKQLREKLKACEQESRENLDGWQRAKADMVNMRQGHIDDLKRAQARGCEKIVEAVAPVLDSFDMAMSTEAWQQVDSTWRAGVEGIHTQLMNALSANGLTIIDPTGDHFNPHEHESISMEATDDPSSDNIVTQTLQKGLKVGERVVRPAKVVVAHHNG